MAQGILIVVITLAVGAAIVVPFFNTMASTPPPVTKLLTKPPVVTAPPEAGTTLIAILPNSQVTGNPDFKPDDDAKVPLGNKIVWDNQDTAIHTATAGIPSDPSSPKAFDTGLIQAGSKSPPVETKAMKEGDSFPYYCQVHPFMTSKLTIVPPAANGTQAGNQTQTGGGAASGTTLTIPNGAQVQGNPSYQPAELTAKKGDSINVVNDDTAIHTVTSGTGLSDSNSAKAFDTGFIQPASSGKIETSAVPAGDYDFYCAVHPFMRGKLKLTS